MTPKEIARLVATLAAAFPHAKMTAATSEVYEMALADLDFQKAQRAALRLITTARFLPSIAELRQSYFELEQGPLRSGAEGWQDALAQVRAVGSYGTPEFADPIVSECLRMWGSWQSFCLSPEDDPGGRARFIDLYDTLAKRTATERQAPPGASLPPAPGKGRLK